MNLPDFLSSFDANVSNGLLLGAALILAAAAVCDVRKFLLPDRLSVGMLGLGILFGLTQPDWPWIWHVASFLVVFMGGALLFGLGWMGGGDVKLMSASAVWVCIGDLPAMLSYIFMAGGVLALFLLIVRRLVVATGWSAPRVFHSDAPLPYAVAIMAGIYVWAGLNWPLAA